MAGAGYTIVTARVLDRNGQVYVNANYSVVFVNLNTVPGAMLPMLGTSQFQTQMFGNQCDSDGNLSVTLADNNLVTPSPSQWLFTICSQYYTQPGTRYCFVWQGTITGATIDISAELQAASALLPLPGAGGGGGAVAISDLLSANRVNVLNNESFDQNWNWSLTGTNSTVGLGIAENLPSTNTGPGSVLVAVNTRLGSTIPPFEATAQNGFAGLKVVTNGDITAVGAATFTGPVRLPLANETVLGTDPTGLIIPSVAPGGGGPTPINELLSANNSNDLSCGNFTQAWRWLLTGTTPEDGLFIAEPTGQASTNTGALSALVGIGTHVGSTVAPFRAIAQSGPGLMVNSAGDIIAVVGATFTGPLRIPTILGASSLATDPTGLIVPGTAGGGIATIAVPVSFTAAGSQIVTHNLNTTNPLYSVLSFGGASTWTVAPNDANSVRVTVPSAASLVVSFAYVAPVSAPGPVLASLTLNPTSVQGGVANSTGVVTLTGAAPAGGALVTLISSNPAVASVPGSVTIPAGQTSTSFLVTTSVVSATNTVTITGSYTGGGTQSANLTVTAPPPPAQPVYGGTGIAGATSATSIVGTVATLNNGVTLPQIKASTEVVGDSWQFNPNNEVIYLLLNGGSRTFLDQNNQPFVFNAPIQTTVSGRAMFLYQTTNLLLGPFTVRVNT